MASPQNKHLPISVVIPTFNEQDSIGRCLGSLVEDLGPDDEVIVVDNNSTDRTRNIISGFAGVKMMEEKRQGQLYARITGFDAARNQIIATIDADCAVLPGWLDSLREVFVGQRADALSGYVTSSDVSYPRVFEAIFNGMEFRLNRLLTGHNILFGSNLSLTKNCWDGIKDALRPDTSLWEDYDMTMIANDRGYRIRLITDPLIDMSVRRGRIPILDLRRYFSGWYRTFWPYNKPAAIAAYPLSWVAAGIVLVMRPIDQAAWQFKRLQLAVEESLK